ncbi:hypothetical protein [Paracoccus sp. SM22M-07]|uniref:hypothetical protein n=1 Tax=Paracoccus sp. SM22M-07 TaxID=1520813 RepID=UPI0009127CA5|nr:hypothetical protein [Paracoccus sp. SM22M-07]OJH46148.1 hypothetical protein IE00_02745 [Paracoccus sp. SM22M-07]
MTARPILFSGPMVRALLEGRKTQTRRVLKPWPGAQAKWLTMGVLHRSPSCQLADCDGHLGVQMQHPHAGQRINGVDIDTMSPLTWVRLPYAPGDRLWVKEGWNAFSFSQDGDVAWPTTTIPTAEEMADIRDAAYRVDVQAVYRESERARRWFADQRWRHSIFMPRWASRLTLTVTNVRVQRLQGISEEDAMAEGVDAVTMDDVPRQAAVSRRSDFAALWDRLNAHRAPWASNPWVCAFSFKVHPFNIDQEAP